MYFCNHERLIRGGFILAFPCFSHYVVHGLGLGMLVTGIRRAPMALLQKPFYYVHNDRRQLLGRKTNLNNLSVVIGLFLNNLPRKQLNRDTRRYRLESKSARYGRVHGVVFVMTRYVTRPDEITTTIFTRIVRKTKKKYRGKTIMWFFLLDNIYVTNSPEVDGCL